MVDLAVDLAVEKVLVAVLITQVSSLGTFHSKCWRERSAGVVVAANQFSYYEM